MDLRRGRPRGSREAAVKGRVVAVLCGADALAVAEVAAGRGRARVAALEIVPCPAEPDAPAASPAERCRALLPALVTKRRWQGLPAVVVVESARAVARLWAAPPLTPRDQLGALGFEAEKWCQLPAAELWLGAIARDAQAPAESARAEEENALAVAAPRAAVVPLLEALADAGLEPWGVTLPPLALAALLDAGAPAGLGATQVGVHIGPERSWIAVSAGGRLLLVRDLEVARDGLVSALSMVPVEGQGNVRLTPGEAAALLARVGVVLDDEPFGMADGRIPLESVKFALRPALERLASSINRSLDFCREQYFVELPEAFHLTGEGADIPALDAYLGAAALGRCELGVGHERRLDAEPEAAATWAARPGLAAVVAGAGLGALAGRSLPARARALGLPLWVSLPVRRALAGTAAALALAFVLLGARADVLRRQVADETARAQALGRRLEIAHAEWQQLESSRAEQFLAAAFARDNVRVDGVLKLLSRIVGPDVALTELSLPSLNASLIDLGAPAAAAGPGGEPLPQERDVATLTGLARTDRERLETVLSRLIVALEDAPYFDDVVFVRSEEESAGHASFQLRCRIRQGLRPPRPAPEVASR